MLIGGLQRMTLIDYPSKVAAIVFTIGCNFRCRFCYNTRLVDPALLDTNEIIKESDFFDFLKIRIGKLDAIVITGGEPTLQNDLVPFIKKIKQMGFLVKLDTNGTNPDIVRELLKDGLVDYIAMDIKSDISDREYKKIIQVDCDIEKIKESIKLIMDSGIDYEFRTTAAPGITKENIDSIAQYISGAKKYYLQEFKDTDIIDNECKKEHWLSEDELKQIADSIKGLFQECKVR
jgi:pyruvate formate lyase activating enzyme